MGVVGLALQVFDIYLVCKIKIGGNRVTPVVCLDYFKYFCIYGLVH